MGLPSRLLSTLVGKSCLLITANMSTLASGQFLYRKIAKTDYLLVWPVHNLTHANGVITNKEDETHKEFAQKCICG